METGKMITIGALLVLAFGAMSFIFGFKPEKLMDNQNDPYAVLGATAAAAMPASTRYANQSFGFEVTLPRGFIVDESYLRQDLGPGREIPGVAFRIPPELAFGTTLGVDSYVALEELSGVECAPETFLASPGATSESVIGGRAFAVSTVSGEGAGNVYEETVHVTAVEGRCYDVRYFIHSSDILGYEPGMVAPFDRQRVLALFDSIAGSLIIR